MTTPDSWRKIEVWFQGGSREDAERIFDAVINAAHDAKPEGVDMHGSASLLHPAPDWAAEGADT